MAVKTIPVNTAMWGLMKDIDTSVTQLLINTLDEISEKLAAGGLPNWEYVRLAGLKRSIRGNITALRVDYRRVLDHNLTAAAGAATPDLASPTWSVYTGTLERHLPGATAKYLGAMADLNMMTLRASYQRQWGDGIKLSRRIWDLGTHTEKEVLDVVRAGMAQQASAPQIAKAVENLGLRPGVRTFRPYGRNLPYDAMRLARTEVAQAFRDAQALVAVNSPWVLGERWNLSAFHDDMLPCDCPMYAIQDVDGLGPGVYHPWSLPLSHPHCMCYVTDETMSNREFNRKLESWTRDPSTWPDMTGWAERIYMADKPILTGIGRKPYPPKKKTEREVAELVH